MYSKQLEKYDNCSITIKRFFFVILLLYSFLSKLICYAQEYNIYDHLNSDNLLQSNRIYNCVQDKYGYLWIATEQGVYKYNGYTVQKFGFSEGLPSEDVWDIVEDSVGRMWLGSITNELGYIQKGKYKKVNIKGYNLVIYPQCMQRYKKAIQFKMPYMSNSMNTELCRYEGDSLRLFPQLYKQLDIGFYGNHKSKVCYTLINEYGEVYFITHNAIYKKGVNDTVISKCAENNSIEFQKYFNLYNVFIKKNFAISVQLLDNVQAHTLKLLNLNNGKISNVDLADFNIAENIEFIYINKLSKSDSVILFTSNNVFFFSFCDSKIKLLNSIPIKNFFSNINGDEIKYFERLNVWGNVIGTINQGLFIKSQAFNDKISLRNNKIRESRYIGTDSHYYYWWSKRFHRLYVLDDNDSIIASKYYSGNIEMRSILPYKVDTAMVFGEEIGSSFLIDLKSYKLNNSLVDLCGWGVQGAVNNNGRFFFISKSVGFGYNDSNYFRYVKKIDADRYNGLIYLWERKQMLVYNGFKMCFYNTETNQKIVYNRDWLSKNGIRKIENVILDENGKDIYVKDYDNVFLLDKRNKIIKRYFTSCNLAGAHLYKFNNALVVVGKFGVAYQKTNNNDSSVYFIFKNFKQKEYKVVFDVQIGENSITINTDKGLYKMLLNKNYLMKNNISYVNYIISTDDTSFLIHKNDTLLLNSHNYIFSIDVVKPDGFGKLQYSISFDDGFTWRYLKNSDIVLPQDFRPGRFYKVLIRVNDDFWKSPVLTLRVFIKPLWWQTNRALIAFLVIGFFFFFFLIVIVILLTRKWVAAANKRRNMRMEIELKSVYSQINPHFIFNTLNSSLYFIRKGKMTEANDHVMKFSRLLRAYIKSSRDKYILLKDEIENLTNYILLQRVRFDHKFNYAIHVEDNIDVMTTKIPSLLLQPLVENAIDHGLFHKEEVGNLLISFKRVGTALVCEIDDDGVGRERGSAIAKGNTQKPESYGSNLIDSLVDIFNRYENMNIEIQYVDKQLPESGTKVIVIIIKK